MKTRLLGNSLQLNASAFFYDYKDMQFYGGLFDSPVGVLFGITNVGDARSEGRRGSICGGGRRAGSTSALGLGLARHGDHEVGRRRRRNGQQAAELAGHHLQHDGPLRVADRRHRCMADVLLAANYQDNVAFDVVRDPPEARKDSYWLTDARIGIGSADERWNVSLWGKNLADERYRTQVIFSSVGFGRNTARRAPTVSASC